MKLFIKTGFLFLLLTLCLGYIFIDNKLKIERLNEIRKNYTREEILYFYETVFFRDDFYEIDQYKGENGGSVFSLNTKIHKWNKDLYIKPFGNYTHKNIENLKKSIVYLNTLQLPIKLCFTEREDYNVKVFYGSKSFIKKQTNYELEEGLGGSVEPSVNLFNAIDSAFIAIDNSTFPDVIYRPNIILEELTQALGIFGDSFSYPNSLFYQGLRHRPPMDKMSSLDEKILQLLYSENIKTGISRKDFLKSFNDIIKASDPTITDYKKFEKFISKKQFSVETIYMLLDVAFSKENQYVSEPHVQKWRNEINCIFQKTISSEDSLTIVGLFEKLKLIPGFPKINLGTKNENGNVIVGYCNVSACDIRRWESRDMLNYQLHSGKILIPVSVKNDKKIEAYFLKALMLLTGFYPIQTKIVGTELFSDEGYGDPDKLFSQYDLELIELFFDKRLKSGMTKKKITAIVRKYYDLGN